MSNANEPPMVHAFAIRGRGSMCRDFKSSVMKWDEGHIATVAEDLGHITCPNCLKLAWNAGRSAEAKKHLGEFLASCEEWNIEIDRRKDAKRKALENEALKIRMDEAAEAAGIPTTPLWRTSKKRPQASPAWRSKKKGLKKVSTKPPVPNFALGTGQLFCGKQ